MQVINKHWFSGNKTPKRKKKHKNKPLSLTTEEIQLIQNFRKQNNKPKTILKKQNQESNLVKIDPKYTRPEKTTKQKFLDNLESVAADLRLHVPKSEQWFQLYYERHKIDSDEYNVVYEGYIPDLINKKYKYIIEIDGSSHNKKQQKVKDKKRDIFFESLGYITYRIKQYDLNKLQNVIKRILEMRKTINN